MCGIYTIHVCKRFAFGVLAEFVFVNDNNRRIQTGRVQLWVGTSCLHLQMRCTLIVSL